VLVEGLRLCGRAGARRARQGAERGRESETMEDFPAFRRAHSDLTEAVLEENRHRSLDFPSPPRHLVPSRPLSLPGSSGPTSKCRALYRSVSMGDVSSLVRMKKKSKRSVSVADFVALHEAAHRRYEVHYERLPKSSPYVGFFHRGHNALSAGPMRTYDLDKERLSAHNPYVGTFHRGYALRRSSPSLKPKFHMALNTLPDMHHSSLGAIKRMLPRPSSLDSLDGLPPAQAVPMCSHHMSVTEPSHSTSSDSTASRSVTPPMMGGGKLPWEDSRTLEDSDESDDETDELVSVKDCLSIPDTVPHNPELCGLQSILPRQSGVRVLDKIGEGSFAKVVLAMNNRNCRAWNATKEAKTTERKIAMKPREGEKIVLKCIRKDTNCLGEDGLKCVQRELAIHQSLMHPNIPPMFGFYEDDVFVTLILGFVEGRELHFAIQQKIQFSEQDTKVISLQILGAIAYLHENSICHRDITPRNILVSPNGGATLIDLGLAVDVRDLELAPKSAGTMGYMAPEAMKEEPVACISDVFSMGCIMYQMLFAFPPFMSYEILSPSKVEFPDPSWGLVISEELTELLEGMLAKDPKDRVASREAVAHAWFDQAARDVVEHILAQQTPLIDRIEAMPTTPKAGDDVAPADACCLKVDGPVHFSTDNDANYFLYAKVINLPSVCSYQITPPASPQKGPASMPVGTPPQCP